MALNAHTRSFWVRFLDPAGAALARIGLTGNGVTVLGLLLTVVAAWLVVVDRPAVGGLVLIGGALADAVDGAVARARGTVGPAGAFFDSVADRIADGVILSAVLWMVRDDPLLFALAAVALVAAEVTSYVRAKAESLGQTCTVGLVERAERSIALVVGLVLHRWLLPAVLVVLAAGGLITVVQRVAHVLPKLREART